ncbi:hypothetical protein QE152_g1853 [Popillia japonica]|uniref:Uncharacterized protein n=1 Tax=Popillia japonica TaxID=7064 RepID=A0AAW1N593_POPJA
MDESTKNTTMEDGKAALNDRAMVKKIEMLSKAQEEGDISDADYLVGVLSLDHLLWDRSLAKRVLEDGRAKISVEVPDYMQCNEVRKILEFLLQNTKFKANGYIKETEDDM